ncbi:MAG: hypothetical protein AABX70_05310 [Nanoarchaeota archaeon]
MKLIGTIHHYDLEGPRRLEKLLQRIKPKKITIETPSDRSPEQVERLLLDRRTQTLDILASVQLPDCVRALYTEMFSQEGYEAMESILYARKEGVQIYGVDHPEVLKTLSIDENMLRRQLEEESRSLPSEVLGLSYCQVRPFFVELFDRMYLDKPLLISVFSKIAERLAQEDVDHLRSVMRADEPEFEEVREQFMADEILRINPDVHIGGLMHMADFPELQSGVPLYRRLGSSVDEIIRLGEVDKL